MEWDVVRQTVEFFTLKTLRGKELMGIAVEQSVEQQIGLILKLRPGAVSESLQKLERTRLIASDWRRTEAGDLQKFYFLTSAGAQRLETESIERQRQLASFVDGEIFDGSFKKFLDQYVNVYCIWPPPHQ